MTTEQAITEGPLRIAVGIDVAEERKGLDLVALDEHHNLVASRGCLTVADVARMVLEEIKPTIVCIDSPSGWSTSGRSRHAERDLARLGISAFATGPDPGDHPFYRWMRVGMAVYRTFEDRYPLYRGGAAYGTAAEVFPNACAVRLAGRLRDPGETKDRFRRAVLRAVGVAETKLPSLDRVDAALGAVTGLRALQSRSTFVGDPDEGVILLPEPGPVLPGLTTPLRPTGQSPAAVTRPVRTASTGGGLCGCGCGAEVARRFRPGHDAKLKSALLRAWRDGDPQAGRRLDELGWLPA